MQRISTAKVTHTQASGQEGRKIGTADANLAMVTPMKVIGKTI